MPHNIQSGDLCVVVGRCETPGLRDRFVIAERVAQEGELMGTARIPRNTVGAWWCVPAAGGTLPALVDLATGGTALRHVSKRPIAAVLLRPIRDPGEDAVDETLLSLRVPA